ncbi:MAG: hypothetical protein PUF82_05445 [Lactobacillus equicursoris]|uniref:hypothetical protein n=1 Tax=Lactobacillus equicursoris TaxID=420645 RepID=UPI00242FF6F6|nr:hypothetical protein [Lactobacillus equicursoris]MDD6407424.1 hypothetical protein [Lactobacillus equicursoris]
MCEYSKDQNWQADRLAYIGQENHLRYEGKEEGIVQSLRYLVEDGMAPDEAMTSLHVPRDKWDEYRKKIEPQKV